MAVKKGATNVPVKFSGLATISQKALKSEEPR